MSTNTSDTEKTITDPAEIRATFAAWAADDDSHPSKLSLVLAPLHDKVWWDGGASDFDGDELPREVIQAAGTGGELPCEVHLAEIGRVAFRLSDRQQVALAPQHVRAIKTNSPLVHREVEGLEYALTLLPGEGCAVGCQNITRAGCRQIVDILAAHLGLEVRPRAEWRRGDRVRVACRVETFAAGDTWPPEMDQLIGKSGTIRNVLRAASGVDYDVELDGRAGPWCFPAASLEAV